MILNGFCLMLVRRTVNVLLRFIKLSDNISFPYSKNSEHVFLLIHFELTYIFISISTFSWTIPAYNVLQQYDSISR